MNKVGANADAVKADLYQGVKDYHSMPR